MSRHDHGSKVQETLIHGVKIYPWRGERLIGDALSATGEYERHVLPIFLELLINGDIVLDVGANVGIYSLLAASRVGKEGMIYAIEPIAKNVGSLCARVIGNKFQNILVMPVAGSDKNSAIAVLRHTDSSNGIVDSHVNSTADADFVPSQRIDGLLAGLKDLDGVKIE